MAAGALRKELGDEAAQVDTSSAGTAAWEDQPATPEAVAVTAADGVDISAHRSRRVTPAVLRGADLVLVASVLNKGIQRIMARPDVKSPADLKGKKVGISRFGSASHTVLQLMLRRWNINPSEIQVIQVGSSPAMLRRSRAEDRNDRRRSCL